MKAYKMMFYKLAAKYNLPQEITKQIFTEGLAPVIIQAAFRGHLDRSRQPAFSWQGKGGWRYYKNAARNAEPGFEIWHYWFREALPQSLLAGFAWNMNELMNVCGWYWRMPEGRYGIMHPVGRKHMDAEVVKAIEYANDHLEEYYEDMPPLIGEDEEPSDMPLYLDVTSLYPAIGEDEEPSDTDSYYLLA